MTRFVLATVAASTLASAASAGFTGYSVQRTLTAGGNSQYQVFANWDQSGLVFLNAFNFATQSGTMNARHQDAAEDADGATAGSVSDSTRVDGAGIRSPIMSESLSADFTG